ncbi:LysR family transcriptional regulator [Bosea sp. (in: a-proteobacteria)]|uniref:LysR family transcriptional regulator n=1 Tax=Bosea sp. (in: a-proteobacteria) TaxID=1871050 RepID=UPI001AC56BA3|nr:LysR family transcriptional regulator [Bosea sp. (in: a-proteobacteria)]MBN9443627.1 LysR family transcriptional regulator [Bosea sp. (in: a-proteobacteria)]
MAELDEIRSFIAVAETGGFGRAAQILGLSKSIVSRRVSRLEEELGARLLSRTTRGVSPTEAGIEFRARSERILADLEEAREAVAQQAGGVAGRLRIAMPLTFGNRHVAPLLRELALAHPRLELDVHASDQFVDLIGERFDAAIRIGTLKDSSLIARRIAPVHASVLGSPAYFARKGRPATPHDLAAHDCLIYTGTAEQEWTFRSGKRWIALRPPGRLRSDSGETLMEWAAAGLGLVVLPNFVASEAILSGALEHVLLDYPMPTRGLYVVRPPGAFVPGKVRVLIDLLVARFSGTPYWDPCQIAMQERGISLEEPWRGQPEDETGAREHQPA